MIVYRKQERTINPKQELACMAGMLGGLTAGSSAHHDQAVELLIEYGELESGITDALCPDADFDSHVTRLLRRAGVLSGHIFKTAWEGRTDETGNWTGKMSAAFQELAASDLPGAVCVRVPEGYAHYGLYPETYLEAAMEFLNAEHPEGIACIGARSIGTSLSSVVCAALEASGLTVVSYTVRPRGHPFYRGLVLSTGFEQELCSLKCSHFIVVDEGPGLSGSSICCVAQKLSELGIADSRIVLFPSWNPDGSNFISESARRQWQRHRKYTVSFEKAWLSKGQLKRDLPYGGLLDISAGAWRPLFSGDVSAYPAIHPYHEQRKYLCSEDIPRAVLAIKGGEAIGPAAAAERPAALFVKFAGLGRYGRAKYERALKLAYDGFCPLVSGFAKGFLTTHVVYGRPLTNSGVNAKMLDAFACYLDYVRKTFPVEQEIRFDEIVMMIERNILVGLGGKWPGRLSFLENFRPLVSGSSAVAIDGRMMPHEWLSAGRGYMKMDSVDHHADQFFPGCQDIAWDMAGTIIEFALDREEQAYLLQKYRSFGDRGNMQERLPFYLIAYLAYRMGYATFAANELGTSPDGRKFRALAKRYSTLLCGEVLRFSG